MVDYDAKIRIYENINDTFILFQTLDPANGSTITTAGAITDDHQWVVFGTYNIHYELEVYKFNGSKY